MNGRVALLAMALLSAGPAIANESVYTDIGRDKCKTIAEEEGMYALMTCPGHADYPVRFKEADIRQSVSFGHLNQRYSDDAFESFIPFNHAGTTVEWRVAKGGAPVATILRWFIENTDASGASVPALQGQVLVISRVAEKDDGKGCVAGYVDALANPDPNALARKVADEVAPTFRCGIDKPAYHGTRGDKAAETVNELPE
ncbi:MULTISPECIES: hypothetical protein [unclassified Ensifer]|uniref:hypothetical protein n=1 Tax=unclassified Ensifer TaxID=2633371 RepID=UPI000812CA61|nr:MULTISPECIES: hypothetical protein [unclassified Ensifer]OCP11051.1 hypothetical protein BC362_00765 [Ensifer sp. LC14]OCP12777.1 hypothetical protein BC374_14400 [Ensifer sp. LC13]OCP13376.1 hypothetical protein BBX50_14265 [Ensifer sp. LC11]OCP34220.1 hypothetical protein BC364_12800 [Ensifer sp. LC499]